MSTRRRSWSGSPGASAALNAAPAITNATIRRVTKASVTCAAAPSLSAAPTIGPRRSERGSRFIVARLHRSCLIIALAVSCAVSMGWLTLIRCRAKLKNCLNAARFRQSREAESDFDPAHLTVSASDQPQEKRHDRTLYRSRIDTELLGHSPPRRH